ncbi:Hypothetical predicted protein [Mytilus galloprovincialis]|uniref:Uncharacterized protein n=1 Tax=Mytilus galloprovincialis TaxID=29158 RepID=A0A8B6FDY2_MYTGA|nr:Hypothetical predicted protein [Mytilus galloprovincialis]
MTNEKLERERMRQEVAITRMVMTVTSVYFVCMVPGRLLAGVMKAGLLRDERQEGYRELIVSCSCRRCRQGSSESPIEIST